MRMFDRLPTEEAKEMLEYTDPEPEEPKVLTVADLISLLQKQDPEMAVVVEGCDCEGDASGVEVHTDQSILITRFGGVGEYERIHGEDD